MLMDIITSMRLFKVEVRQPKDHKIIFSQTDVITLTAELTALSSVLRISQRHYKATNTITCPIETICTQSGFCLNKYIYGYKVMMSGQDHYINPQNWETPKVFLHIASLPSPTLAALSLLELAQHLMSILGIVWNRSYPTEGKERTQI